MTTTHRVPQLHLAISIGFPGGVPQKPEVRALVREEIGRQMATGATAGKGGGAPPAPPPFDWAMIDPSGPPPDPGLGG